MSSRLALIVVASVGGLLACETLVGIDETVVSPDAHAASGGGPHGASGSDHHLAGGNANAPASGGMGGAGDDSSSGGGVTPGGGAGASGGAGAAIAGSDAGAAGTGASVDTGGETYARTFRVRHPWPLDFVPVCYVASGDVERTAHEQAFVNRVRTLVESSWAPLIDLTFYGWAECDDPTGLVLALSATGPMRVGLGYPGDFAPRIVMLGTEASSDAEILYAFGRALGFEHEFGRHAYAGICSACSDDDDCAGNERKSCLPSGFCGNLADHESIMAAPDCGGIEPIRRLTAWDALGAQRAYGQKHHGALVNRAGLCLNVAQGLPAPGASLIGYPCIGVENDTWGWSSAPAAGEADWLRVTIEDHELCAEVAGVATGDQALPLVSASCSRAVQEQDVKLAAVRWRAMGNMCIAVPTADAGSRLMLSDCGSSPFERWAMDAGHFELAGSGLCATVVGGLSVLGVPLALAPCDPHAAAQTFKLRRREIQYIDEHGVAACLNVAGGVPAPSSALVLWNGCNLGLENEAFYATGPIEIAGQCLDMLSDVYAGVAPCNGSTMQEWDYHW